MIAIVGASGNTGSVVAESLIAHGKKVRVLGRNAGHLEKFTSQGAEAFTADATDAVSLTNAFEGAEAVYAMVPPNPSSPDFRAYQDQISDALTKAIASAAVPKAVVLSSVGADKPEKTGPVTGLHRLEEKLNGVAGLDAIYLRAGYFMENLVPQAAVIQKLGMLAGPVRADLPLPMIVTRDIGAAAAELLLKPDFTGKQPRELLGQRDVTYAQIAPIIGNAIGKPGLKYSKLPALVLRPALKQMGLSGSVANALLEMAEALNSGHMVALEPRSEGNTTPTPIETFIAKEFVPRFQAA